MSAAEYSCALFLHVAQSTNSTSNMVVTLHNTVPGTNYTLWSKPMLVATQAWTAGNEPRWSNRAGFQRLQPWR